MYYLSKYIKSRLPYVGFLRNLIVVLTCISAGLFKGLLNAILIIKMTPYWDQYMALCWKPMASLTFRHSVSDIETSQLIFHRLTDIACHIPICSFLFISKILRKFLQSRLCKQMHSSALWWIILDTKKCSFSALWGWQWVLASASALCSCSLLAWFLLT